MIRAGTGYSTARYGSTAALEAAQSAMESGGLSRVDAALVFATPHHVDELSKLLRMAGSALGTEAFIGGTSAGVFARGTEHEGGPAVAVLALEGLEARTFLFPDLRDEAALAGEEIAARLGGEATECDLALLIVDPYALDEQALLSGLHRELGAAKIAGAGAADAGSMSPTQWCGERAATGALAGLVLRTPSPARIGVTQSCRPVTELLTVTRVEGNWVLELDGRPALDLFAEVARGPLAADLQRAGSFVFVALPRNDEESLKRGSYMIRNVAGFSKESRAFALAQPLRRGDRVALALREPGGARQDLKQMLDGLGPQRPAAGIYFDCCARGAGFFGVDGLESAYLDSAFRGVPIAGMLGACEIGPLGGRTELLTYTGVLALLDP